MNLSTTYLGLQLRTPLVPSASPFSEKVDNIKRMEDAGASAVVFHSLFEEQVQRDHHELQFYLDQGTDSHAESLSYFPNAEFKIGPDSYLDNLSQAKASVGIPIIGSLNGTTFGGWMKYARQLEEAGADALELNIYNVPSDPDRSAEDIENEYLTIIASVRAQVKIPVAVVRFGVLSGRTDGVTWMGWRSRKARRPVGARRARANEHIFPCRRIATR